MPDTADAFVYGHTLEVGIDAWTDTELRDMILAQQTEVIVRDAERLGYEVVDGPHQVATYFYYFESVENDDDEALKIWCDETDPQARYAKNMMEVHCRATNADHTRPAAH